MAYGNRVFFDPSTEKLGVEVIYRCFIIYESLRRCSPYVCSSILVADIMYANAYNAVTTFIAAAYLVVHPTPLACLSAD